MTTIGPTAVLEEPLARITAAQQQLLAAEQALADAKAEAALRLWEAIRPYREDGGPAPAAIISTLYWDHPELRAEDVARAVGCSVASLSRLAGPRQATATCRTCDGELTWMRRSRSASPPGECDSCRERSEAQLRARAVNVHPLGGSSRFSDDLLPDARYPFDADPYSTR